MRRLLAFIPAGLLALASFLPAYAAPATSDPLLLAPLYIDKEYGATVTAGTGSTTAFTYTVPTGRVFRMETARVEVQGNQNNTQAAIQTASNQYVALVNTSTTAGPNNFAVDQTATELFLPAGTVITATYQDPGAANEQIFIYVHGVEFNAP